MPSFRWMPCQDFRHAYGMREQPATEVAGYYRWSLRDRRCRESDVRTLPTTSQPRAKWASRQGSLWDSCAKRASREGRLIVARRFNAGGVRVYGSRAVGTTETIPQRRQRACDSTATPYTGSLTDCFDPPSSTSFIAEGSETVCSALERFTRMYTVPFAP